MTIENVNMMDHERYWPRDQAKWWHSDMVHVAYRYLSRFFDMIVNGTEEESNEG